jgi:hypothetical protein
MKMLVYFRDLLPMSCVQTERDVAVLRAQKK